MLVQVHKKSQNKKKLMAQNYLKINVTFTSNIINRIRTKEITFIMSIKAKIDT